MKIKVGSKRYDVLGSFQPYLRVIAQEITGEKKNVNTGEVKPLGYNPLGAATGQDQTDHYPGFGDETRGTVLWNFFQNKLAPIPSLLVRGMEQTKGQKIDWHTEALKMGVPMWLPDIYKATEKDGAAGGAGVLIPSFIGWGVQDYDAPSSKKKGNSKSDEFGFPKAEKDTGFKSGKGTDEFGFPK